MAVNISGEGALEWDAVLTVDGFINGTKVIDAALQATADKATEAAKVTANAFEQTTLAQTGLAKNAEASADAVFNAWKTRAAEIVRLAKEAGVKAGESFEFKNPTINGIESSTFISSEQIRQMEVALTILDGALTTQEQIAKTGLTEIEYLETKKNLLEELGQQLDADSASQIEALERQQQLERDIADAKRNTANDVVKKRTGPSVENILGDEFKNILKDAGQSFDDLDNITKRFIQNLIDTELKLGEVAAAQKAVDEARDKGKISLSQYAETSAQLAAQQKTLSNDLSIITNGQKEYEASLQRTVGSIEDKKAALVSLKSAYEKLSTAEAASPEGQNLSKKIADLKNEIKGLEPGKIEGTKTAIVNVQTELRNLQNLMAANPNSPMFNTWRKQASELKLSVDEAKKSINQATNDTAGIEAFATGLRGIVGGFTAATGAIGLFTDDTEDVERVTKNAASALALLNGVQEISNVLAKNGALNVYLLGLARKAQTVDTVASTAATEVATIATTVNTVATGAQTTATVGATAATRSLSLAMLANPAGILVAAIAALAVAYLVLRDNSKLAAEQQKRLAEYTKDVAEGVGKESAELQILRAKIESVKVPMAERLQAVKDLKEQFPSYFADLENEKILNGDVAAAYALAADGILKKARANAAAKQIEALATKSIGVDKTAVDDAVKTNKAIKEATDKIEIIGGKAQESKITQTREEAQRKLKKDFEYRAELRNKERAEIKAESDFYIGTIISNADVSKEAYETQRDEREKAEKEAERLRKSASKELKKDNQEYNKLLEEQKGLLELINGLKRDALQSGMTKELSELDKINEKYDIALVKIAEFNKKAPKNLQINTTDVNDARKTELQNQVFKNEAKAYKESLNEQQKAFEDYENFKADFGKEKADELFAAQTKGSASYLEYLKKQKEEIENSVSIGPNPELNNGQILKSQELLKRIADEEAKIRKDAHLKQLADYRELLEAAVTYNEQRAAINKRYDELEATAFADISGGPEQQAKRLKILEDGRKTELQGVNRLVLQETELYRKLNQDILGFTNKRIKEEIASIRKAIADKNTEDKEGNIIAIPPELLAQLEEYIKKLEEAANKQRKLFGVTGDEFLKAGGLAKSLAGDIASLADAIAPFNKGLSNTVSDLADMAEFAGNALDAMGKFASGDIAGAISSALKNIVGIFKTIAASKESARKANQEVLDFQTRIINGEAELNRIQQERERQTIKLNKLKIDGLKEELALLEKQRALNNLSYNEVLTQLQNESFVSGETTKKKRKAFGVLGAVGAALGFGSTTSVVQQFSSLSGKNYDDLEALFMKGQLTGKAKELFEQLQKIKETGVDIDQALADNKIQAQQLYTGTTADSILDSIVQGFADGKRATADFADDFEKLMKQSVLNALKYQALEKPLKEFYENFAAAAESDGILTAAEIAQLQAAYNATITAAGAQFDQLKQITDLNFSNNAAGGGNSLQGAIKGITQQQADLLAGQFGGLRITAFEQLAVAKSHLNALNIIVNNTSLLIQVEAYLHRMHTVGIKVI